MFSLRVQGFQDVRGHQLRLTGWVRTLDLRTAPRGVVKSWLAAPHRTREIGALFTSEARLDGVLRLSDCYDAVLFNIAMDEHSLAVLRNMLRGATRADIIERMRDEYDDEDVSSNIETILGLYEGFRDSLLLRSVFAAGGERDRATDTEAR